MRCAAADAFFDRDQEHKLSMMLSDRGSVRSHVPARVTCLHLLIGVVLAFSVTSRAHQDADQAGLNSSCKVDMT